MHKAWVVSDFFSLKTNNVTLLKKNNSSFCAVFQIIKKWSKILVYSVNKIWASRLKAIKVLLLRLLAFPNVIDFRESNMNLPLSLTTAESKQMLILLLAEFKVHNKWK